MLESQAEFARRMAPKLGREVARSTVKRWADAGRIVMTGKLVDVEASERQLNATQGARDDVADRHTQEHAEKSTTPPSDANSGPNYGQHEPLKDQTIDKARHIRAVAEARIRHAEAEIREMERDEQAKRLMQVADVNFALDDYGATLRGLMETFADRLAPVIYPLQSLEETYATLSEAAETVLSEMANEMEARALRYGNQNG